MRVEIGGEVIEFPEGMSEEEINAAAAKIYAQQQAERGQAESPQPESTRPEQPAADPPGRLERLMHGAMDPVVGGIQLIENAKLSPTRFGSPRGSNEYAQQREQEYQERRGPDAGIDGYRLAGNLATGSLFGLGGAPVRSLAGWAGGKGAALSLPGRMQAGAISGALGGASMPVEQPTENFWKDKSLQAGVGMGAGIASPVVSGASARLINPRAATNPDVKLLREAGVTPTAAQTAGGAAKTIEEQLTSLPIVGTAIANRQGNALHQFNTAAINRAVAPVGRSVEGFGHEAVEQAHKILTESYDAARATMRGPVLVTNNMREGIAQLRQQSDTLTDAMQRRFLKELDQGIGQRMQQVSIGPDDYKVIDSKLGKLAREYGRSQDPTQRELGDLFAGLRSTLRDGLQAQNPEAYEMFRAADTGWANLMVVDNAATRAANNAGVFTPGQLTMSVRAADDSISRRSTAQGKSLMQDLATAGQNVIGNRYPDSGSPARAALSWLMTGGATLDPMLVTKMGAGLAGGAGGYLGLNPLARAAISRRPPGAGLLADGVRLGGGVAAPGVGAGAAGLLEEQR